jgi:putative endonuclease
LIKFNYIAGPARIATQSVAGGSSKMFFYTYVLKSKKDGKLYVGWSNNLKLRMQKHNKGLVSATKYRLPIELVYYEACSNKNSAIIREKQLKTGFGRAYLKRRLGC